MCNVACSLTKQQIRLVQFWQRQRLRPPVGFDPNARHSAKTDKNLKWRTVFKKWLPKLQTKWNSFLVEMLKHNCHICLIGGQFGNFVHQVSGQRIYLRSRPTPVNSDHDTHYCKKGVCFCILRLFLLLYLIPYWPPLFSGKVRSCKSSSVFLCMYIDRVKLALDDQ